MRIKFPHPAAKGGPGSFQLRIEKLFKEEGWKIFYSSDKDKPDIIFIVGGTKKIFWLLKYKIQCVPIIYRLDGIEWLHRKKFDIKKILYSELINTLCKFIHAFLADKIVYQSNFVKKWWNQKGWIKHKNVIVIHNGVEIKENNISNLSYSNRLVILEGTVDYSPYVVDLINDLSSRLPDYILIEVYGRFEVKKRVVELDKRVRYFGQIPRNEVLDVLKNSIYLSMDINPACPNTVIEALSVGAPVVGFDTGSLKELVGNKAGIIVPYGSNPWELGYPDSNELTRAITCIINNYQTFSLEAKKTAILNYSAKSMFKKYKTVMNSLIK